jgi:enamine deaminase RidA (YjgF/YER057c/UK114 family)
MIPLAPGPDVVRPPWMDKVQFVRCDDLAAPRGYSHGTVVSSGRLLFVAGQIGWDRECRVVGPDLAGQFAQALDNFMAVVRAAGGSAQGLCQMTVYVTDRQEYLAHTGEIGAAWRRIIGREYPAMALVEVKALLEPAAKVEIQGVVSL